MRDRKELSSLQKLERHRVSMTRAQRTAAWCGLAAVLLTAVACDGGVESDPNAEPQAPVAASMEAVRAALIARTRPGVTGPEDPSTPRFNKFHTADEVNASLAAWSQEFPSLTELYSIGETLRGSPLMVLEITNEGTGPAADKPGYYYDGNIHAGELTGGEVALHFAWYLLSNYGSDEQVTRLVDMRAIYIRPKFNPDGADIALTTAQALRSTPRPYDNDLDSLRDEDPPNDLDKDGYITQMRIPNPDGAWYISPDDARLMLRAPGRGGGGRGGAQGPPPLEGTQFYDVMGEGIDGRLNEDGVGGIDMNRNAEQLEVTFSDKATRAIVGLSQGLPHYTHLLGRESVRKAARQGHLSVGLRYVRGGVASAITNAQETIRDQYARAVRSARKDALYSQVLLSCALAKKEERSSFRASDVTKPMSTIMGKRYDIPAIARHLKAFLGAERARMLLRSGKERNYIYRFRNPLMESYVLMRGIAEDKIEADLVSVDPVP